MTRPTNRQLLLVLTFASLANVPIMLLVLRESVRESDRGEALAARLARLEGERRSEVDEALSRITARLDACVATSGRFDAAAKELETSLATRGDRATQQELSERTAALAGLVGELGDRARATDGRLSGLAAGAERTQLAMDAVRVELGAWTRTVSALRLELERLRAPAAPGDGGT